MRPANIGALCVTLMVASTATAQFDVGERDSESRSTQAQARLEFANPTPAIGDTFEASVIVTDGSISIASYALRVLYDPAVLQIEAISGGVYAGFSRMPTSDVASYARGVSDFTAVASDTAQTPDEYQVATVRFRVVADSQQATMIGLQNSPGGGMVDAKNYALLHTRFAAPARVHVGGKPRSARAH